MREPILSELPMQTALPAEYAAVDALLARADQVPIRGWSPVVGA
jgi:hypothetical protein